LIHNYLAAAFGSLAGVSSEVSWGFLGLGDGIGAALDAVDFDVLATANGYWIDWHDCSLESGVRCSGWDFLLQWKRGAGKIRTPFFLFFYYIYFISVEGVIGHDWLIYIPRRFIELAGKASKGGLDKISAIARTTGVARVGVLRLRRNFTS